MSLSASPVSQTSVTGVCHSTFEFLLIGRSSQSIVVGLLRFWDSLKFKKDCEFMVTIFESRFVKIDRFEIARCSNMYKITDHQFLSASTIIDKVITSAPEINLQMWLGKSVLSRAWTSQKKQLESLSVSSMTNAYEEDKEDNQDQ
ncbi:hypothetical protein Bca4012_011274 [Brassica carinata]